jgi:hypothetical protein
LTRQTHLYRNSRVVDDLALVCWTAAREWWQAEATLDVEANATLEKV